MVVPSHFSISPGLLLVWGHEQLQEQRQSAESQLREPSHKKQSCHSLHGSKCWVCFMLQNPAIGTTGQE